jgi:hypothetical protein
MGTDNELRGHMIKRSRGLFDTREYEIKFKDGTHEKYQANVIAANMFAQVDSEGNQFLLLQEITDHKEDLSAVPVSEEGTVRTHTSANGQAKPKVTTGRGWSEWKKGDP